MTVAQRRRCPSTRLLTAFWTVVLPLVLSGCGREAIAASSAPPQQRAATAGSGTDWDSVVVEPGVAIPPRARFVGRLPHPLSWYAKRGGAFHALVRDKGWYGHARRRPCEGCPTGQQAEMQVQAISNLHRDPLTPLPRFGVVVGRVMNIGRYTDATTRIPAGRGSHPDQYYFVTTERGRRDTARLWVVRVKFDSLGHPLESLRIFRAKSEYVKCPDHREPPRAVSEGDFRDCPSPSPTNRAPGAQSGTASIVHLASFARLPAVPPAMPSPYAWFSCDAGCCSAKWPP